MGIQGCSKKGGVNDNLFQGSKSSGQQNATSVLLCSALMILHVSLARAQQKTDAPGTNQPTVRDAQHDFDWDIGAWKLHMKRLVHPLTGSTTWVEYDGTDTVRKVWDGRANLGEVEADGPAGHIELLTLRLYNPDTHQWSLNITGSGSGVLSPPAVGEFKDGHASDITARSARFEQAFSADWGKTWELNLIVTETLMKDAPK